MPDAGSLIPEQAGTRFWPPEHSPSRAGFGDRYQGYLTFPRPRAFPGPMVPAFLLVLVGGPGAVLALRRCPEAQVRAWPHQSGPLLLEGHVTTIRQAISSSWAAAPPLEGCFDPRS